MLSNDYRALSMSVVTLEGGPGTGTTAKKSRWLRMQIDTALTDGYDWIAVSRDFYPQQGGGFLERNSGELDKEIATFVGGTDAHPGQGLFVDVHGEPWVINLHRSTFRADFYLAATASYGGYALVGATLTAEAPKSVAAMQVAINTFAATKNESELIEPPATMVGYRRQDADPEKGAIDPVVVGPPPPIKPPPPPPPPPPPAASQSSGGASPLLLAGVAAAAVYLFTRKK